jgi:hypothetical protein
MIFCALKQIQGLKVRKNSSGFFFINDEIERRWGRGRPSEVISKYRRFLPNQTSGQTANMHAATAATDKEEGDSVLVESFTCQTHRCCQ